MWQGFVVAGIVIAAAILYSLAAITKYPRNDDDFWTGY